jgi:hypothetical protein
VYIIEILVKFFQERKNKKNIPIDLENIEAEEVYDENCEHMYVAIDSTQDYFACSKCGNVVKNTNKPRNIFKR